MSSRHTPGIIFVGAFKPTRNNMWGGQGQACSSLLSEAKATTDVQWFLVDTGMRTLPPPGIAIRVLDAVLRLQKVVWLLLTKRVDGVLIFSGLFPTGILEKGVMCLVARVFGKRVVLAPRSEVVKYHGVTGFLNPFLRLVLSSCQGVICQSVEAKDRLRSYFQCRESKLVVISGWIDLAPYLPIARGRRQRSSDKPITFVFLGMLLKGKGVYELLTAFEGVVRNCPFACRLILCGHGEEREGLQERVNAAGLSSNVDFRGFVDLEGKLRALEESDIFVLPTYSEGLPNALLEAMASQIPCVTTPVGGIPSVIHHEVNGLLVPPKDPVALEAAMMRLASDPVLRANLAEQGFSTVERNHQIAGSFSRIADLLEIPQRRTIDSWSAAPVGTSLSLGEN